MKWRFAIFTSLLLLSWLNGFGSYVGMILLCIAPLVLVFCTRPRQDIEKLRNESTVWAEAHFLGQDKSAAQRTIKVISQQTSIPCSGINPSSRFIEDLKLDDLDPVELVMAIEEEFNFKIPNEDAEKILTVSDLITYVHRRMSS